MRLIALATTIAIVGCTDAQIASQNLSKAADQFEINRRVVFINGITGEYLLQLEGRCSILDQSRQLEVTCKHGPDDYRKHFLGLSDNTTYFAEQMEGYASDIYHYRLIFKPAAIVLNIDLETEGGNK